MAVHRSHRFSQISCGFRQRPLTVCTCFCGRESGPISEICGQIHFFRHPIPECMSRDHHAVGFALQGKQSTSARSVVFRWGRCKVPGVFGGRFFGSSDDLGIWKCLTASGLMEAWLPCGLNRDSQKPLAENLNQGRTRLGRSGGQEISGRL